MATNFEGPTIMIIEERSAPKWNANILPIGSPGEHATVSKRESLRREADEEMEVVKKLEAAEKAFLNKWDPVTPQTGSSGYWNRTASRLYWALSYSHFEDEPEKQLEMAKDLLAIYGDHPGRTNSSIVHATDLVKRHS